LIDKEKKIKGLKEDKCSLNRAKARYDD